MGLFDNFSQFLENQLEEFLRRNPHLELSALEEQLKEQEEDTLRFIADLQRQEKNLQDEILNTAKDIERWHNRVNRAQSENRLDLAEAAQERKESLLRRGNQLWGQMQGYKERLEKSKELYYQIQNRRKEIRTKMAEVAANQSNQANNQDHKRETSGWNQTSYHSSVGDPLEEKFKRWEMDDELEKMKREMGK